MAEKMPDDLLPDDKPLKEDKEEKEEPKVEKAEHEEGHSNSDGEFSRMLGLLAKKGIKLPDNTTQKNLSKWLLIVLEALMANSPAPMDVGPPPDLGTALPETPPMVGMSLNGQPIGPVAEKLLMAEQERQSNAAKAILETLPMRGVPKDVVDELAAKMSTNAIWLSLSPSGDTIPSQVMVQLSLLDRALPKETGRMRIDAAQPVKNPLIEAMKEPAEPEENLLVKYGL